MVFRIRCITANIILFELDVILVYFIDRIRYFLVLGPANGLWLGVAENDDVSEHFVPSSKVNYNCQKCNI